MAPLMLFLRTTEFKSHILVSGSRFRSMIELYRRNR